MALEPPSHIFSLSRLDSPHSSDSASSDYTREVINVISKGAKMYQFSSLDTSLDPITARVTVDLTSESSPEKESPSEEITEMRAESMSSTSENFSGINEEDEVMLSP